VASIQGLIVALLVLGCTCYAAWKLMPSVARRSLAAALLRIPNLPAAVQTGLRRNAAAASGCGCDGCDHASPKPAKAASAQPITFHPRSRR
jgi:hypothetical protein